MSAKKKVKSYFTKNSKLRRVRIYRLSTMFHTNCWICTNDKIPFRPNHLAKTHGSFCHLDLKVEIKMVISLVSCSLPANTKLFSSQIIFFKIRRLHYYLWKLKQISSYFSHITYFRYHWPFKTCHFLYYKEKTKTTKNFFVANIQWKWVF